MEALPPIVLVDDTFDDRLILSRLLAQAGVKNKLVTFERPAAACSYLEKIMQGPENEMLPVMIFTDLNMPEMDGCAFAKWLREHLPHHIPIIMATGSANEEDPKRAIEAGVSRVYAKFPRLDILSELARASGCVVA